MYPYKIITFPDGTGVTLYELFILIGVIGALVMFRILADRRQMPAKMQNLILLGAVAAFVIGYLSAVLFQAVYNALETGKFVIDGGTGATFYGGFIGGAISMLLIYFIGMRILYKEFTTAVRWLPTFANIAAVCIPLAHGFGRLGCLTAGCCHGKFTDAWYGITQWVELSSGHYGWAKVVPIQLFEALFLFALAAALFVLVWKKKGFGLSCYFIGYGIWRFIIEFFRTDDRGASFIPGLTPSQVTALLLILIGSAIIAAYFILLRKKGKNIFLPPDLKTDDRSVSVSEDKEKVDNEKESGA